MPDPVPLKKLRQLYYDEKLSVQEIAAKLGMSRQAVYERFRNNGISLRGPQSKTGLSKEEISDLYENRRLTIKQIAKQTSYSVWDVTKDLELYEIPRSYRRNSKFNYISNLKEGEQIIVKNESGTYPTSILKLAKKLGIRIVIRRIDAERFLVIRTLLLTQENIMAMRDTGLTITKIAETFCCTRSTIARHLPKS